MYRIPFRQAVIRVYSYTGSMRKTAAICSVSAASVCRWLKRLEPKCRLGQRKILSDALVASVDAFMRNKTRCSSTEVVTFIQDVWKISISRQLAHCIIKRLGFTYKRTRKRSASLRSKTLPHTNSFFERFQTAFRDGTLAAIDESGFDQRCHPIYGYAPAGSQAITEVVPCKDRRRYNLIMAIHQSGTHQAVIHDVSTTSVTFSKFLEQLPYPSGTTIILDNVSFHRVNSIFKIADNKGYDLLFTPPYSPEYNPIELVFGNIKNLFYRERYAYFGQTVRPVIERCIQNRTTNVAVSRCFRHVHDLITRFKFVENITYKK